MHTPLKICVDERHVIDNSEPCGLIVRSIDGGPLGSGPRQQPYPRWPIGGLIKVDSVLIGLGIDVLPLTNFRESGKIMNERVKQLTSRASNDPRRPFIAAFGDFQVRWNPETDGAAGDWTFVRPAVTPRQWANGRMVTEHPSDPRLLVTFVIEHAFIALGGTYAYSELEDAVAKFTDTMTAGLRIIEGEVV